VVEIFVQQKIKVRVLKDRWRNESRSSPFGGEMAISFSILKEMTCGKNYINGSDTFKLNKLI
jgi:hypothetical protein